MTNDIPSTSNLKLSNLYLVPSCCRACGYLAAYCLLISTHNSRQTCQTSNIQTSQLPAPDGHDYDGQPAIPLIRPDYITEVKRWRMERVDDNGELANLEKPKQRYIRLLENALFGFGLSKLGKIHRVQYSRRFRLSRKWLRKNSGGP